MVQSRLSLQLESVSSIDHPFIKSTEPLTIAAPATGNFDPNYDKFNYALNTTQCPNGTLCPFANNQNCCDKNRGIQEVHYNDTSSAVMPTDVAALTTFYAAAGYTFPTSIPSQSAPPTDSPLTPTASSVPDSSLPGPISHSDQVGLGIGITLSVIVCGLCAILLHLFIRRRRRRQQQQPNNVHKETQLTSVHGYSTELEGTNACSEMEDSQKAHELHDGDVRSLRF
ncbi:hypothetical protein IMSHALPRED_003228 [Imshaugia aleurites]|uniref:Mid2 domain-containing protein n=1 Tax=Imshaugia aleurites TaxID=172621 RepID=A0A8H3I6C1_9LECA|nr:hypothetical protein IMSHALPRED_003228 [Imshaugia aleurites]